MTESCAKNVNRSACSVNLPFFPLLICLFHLFKYCISTCCYLYFQLRVLFQECNQRFIHFQTVGAACQADTTLQLRLHQREAKTRAAAAIASHIFLHKINHVCGKMPRVNMQVQLFGLCFFQGFRQRDGTIFYLLT